MSKKSINNKKKPAFGTQEWASSNVNIVNGCSNDCLYCYAKSMAIRFGRKSAETWLLEEVKQERLHEEFKKYSGTVMFPSSHDISPRNVDACLTVLEKLLKVGNHVLVVSKPHLEVIQKLCAHFQEYKEQILFRFTIGSCDSETLRFWEPYAPSLEERLDSLKHAYSQGFRTSVSCEPALDGDIYDLVKKLSPFVTDSIWIGLANRLKGNLTLNGHSDPVTLAKADELVKMQNKAWVLGLYKMLKENPKVRWKDSCKKILGIDRALVAGLDV